MITERLVTMANQIAASVPVQADAAGLTATHLGSFWSPAMIDELSEFARAHPEALTPAAAEALARLRPEEARHG